MRVWLAGVGLAAVMMGGATAAGPREVLELSDGWRFTVGDPEQAETIGYDDKGWRIVSVPHDWQIAGPIDQKARAGGAGGFFPTGVAWYRRTLDVRPRPGRRVFVELDGVMERSGVWINGQNVGYRPNGYVGQRFDVTPFLKGDGRDVLAVRADTSRAPSSRWYAGGGVYRKARLIETGETHIVQNSVFVTTPSITDGRATVRVQADITNAGETPRQAGLEVVLFGPDGREVGKTRVSPVALAAGATQRLSADLELASPQRWNLDDPKLYRAEVRVADGKGEVADVETVRFGVRAAEFKADTGFWLNGRNIKLKGVALHEDGGAVGMAVPLSIWRQRLTTLKAMGVNAIRTAHNPAAPGLLDLADELGIAVMDELYDQWNVAKTPYDYHLFFGDWSRKDAFDIVARDRNHASVVIWSIGNEIHDTAFPVQAKAALKSLSDVVHATDPTRPVTQALFRPNVTGDYENGLADMLDVVGQNYRENELLKAHADNPARKIIGTENSHNRASWLAIRDSAAAAGMFLWTGVDYLGEADRRGWPNIDSPSGLLDRTGAPRIRGLERESWWSEKPVLNLVRNAAPEAATPSVGGGEGPAVQMPVTIQIATPQKPPQLFADWTPADLSPHPETVEVYSNCASVRVSLNGKDLGAKPLPADASPRRWAVTFAPGRVVATCDGSKTRAELRTAGPATQVVLEPDDKAVGGRFDDAVYVRARIADALGTTVPSAAQPITFAAPGGVLIATDNASGTDHTPFTARTRAALDGKAVALVRAGQATAFEVTATAPGLKAAVVKMARR